MTKENETSFTQGELEALKQIVSDWLQEEIVVQPFEAEILAIMEKLGIEISQTGAAAAQNSAQAGSRAPGPTSLA